jgi:ceramide glucosyltransferase
LGFAAVLLALAGCAYALLAANRIGAFRARSTGSVADSPPVSVLKPLHGAEPGLAAALASFVAQDYAGPVQLVFGVQDQDDAAIAAAAPLCESAADAVLVVDATPGGANAKITNLSHIVRRARHAVLVLSDSDIRVRPDYLRRISQALAEPGVGVVTCPYYGVANAGFWSRMAAMGISYQFLPSVAVGVGLGLATPCMGSTIALRRDTLEAIGGFEAFADVLADDYAIGAAVRATGARSVVAPVLVAHGCAEARLGDLFAHELRWARTIRGVDPAGFFGSAVTHPAPLALIACLLAPTSPLAWTTLGLALAVRLWLMRQVDIAADLPSRDWWILPFRDLISFGVFLAALFGRDVNWRGQRYRVDRQGTMFRT